MKKNGYKLKLGEVFCIASGAMISSGLFILPGIAFSYAGPSVILSYLIAGIACIPTVLSMAELSSAMPKAGGDYFYITRGFGPFVGTLSGFGSWFALSFKSAFALIGMSAYISMFINLPIQYLAVILCILFVILNIIGIKEASRTQVILVVGLISILLTYVIWGSFYLRPENFIPFFSKGHISTLRTASFVFVSYGGLTKIVAMAEEIEKSEKNLLRGMILSLLVVMFLYILVVLVTIGVVPSEILSNTITPISDGAKIFGGQNFQKLVGLAAFFAFISTANAGIMSASRYLLGMSRDKHLPEIFQKINRKNIPYIAVLTTGMFMIFSLLVFPLEILVKIGSIIFLMLYILANSTVIIFRESKITSYQPTFYSPFYPYTQIIGIFITGLLILETSTGIIFLTILFLFVCGIIYKYTLHKKVVRDSALEHLLKKLIKPNKKLTTIDVESELREIVISRDKIEESSYYQKMEIDIFEKIIKNSSVLDLDEPLNSKLFFRRISDALSKELKINKLELMRKLIEKEKSSNLIVEEGIAMLHLIIEGKDIVKVLFVRNKNGVVFTNGYSVKTTIVILSSSDKQALHLKLLSYFLTMIKAPDFNNELLLQLKKDELIEKTFEFIIKKIQMKYQKLTKKEGNE